MPEGGSDAGPPAKASPPSLDATTDDGAAIDSPVSSVDSEADSWVASEADSSVDSPVRSDDTSDLGVDSTADVLSEPWPNSSVSPQVEASADSFVPLSIPAGANAVLPRSPGMLSGLVLWLDSTTGLSYSDAGTGAIAWQDQSGLQNDATSVGAPYIRSNVIGGKTAVHFNGTTDYLFANDSFSLRFSTGDFLIAVVGAHTTPTAGGIWNYGLFYVKEILDTSPYLGVAIGGNALDRTTPRASLWSQVAFEAMSWVQSSEATFNDGRPLCIILHRFSVGSGVASLVMRVNGAELGADTGTGYAVDVNAMGYPVFIGGTPGQQDIAGDIAEVVAVKGAVADSDVIGLEAYLMDKYHL